MRPIALPALIAIAVLAAQPAWCETVTVKLQNGDLITGEVIERTAEHIVIQHPLFGRLEIPNDEVSTDTLHPGIGGTRFLEGWDKEVSVGLSGSEGDTDEMDLLVGGDLDYTDAKKRWQIRARYALSYSENEKDDHNAQISALRDWLF